MWKWIVICIVVSILAFIVGFYHGDNVYMWVIIPFHNANGEFDYGIMWTAFGAIGTILLSIITVWQTARMRYLDILEKNTVKIISDNTHYTASDIKKIDRNNEYKQEHAINEVVISKPKSKKKGLVMRFEYKTFNDCIPEEYVISNVKLSLNNGGDNILSQDMKISKKALVCECCNPFNINITIIDDNIDLDKNEFWVTYSVTFIRKSDIGDIAVDYECVNKLTIGDKTDIDMYNTTVEKLITFQIGRAYKI